MPLSDVIDCYGPDDDEIDFLKVDVEGWEAEVLASADWARHRPRVVLVEAVNDTGEPTHVVWESGLLDAGYRFAMFDGLNRFYCREEDAERLLPRLGAPANVLDKWLRASEAQAHDEAARAQAEKADEAARAQAEKAMAEQHAIEQARLHEEAIMTARDRAASAEARAEALGADAEEARANEAAAERRAKAAALDIERLREELTVAKEGRDVLSNLATRSQAAAATALRREAEAEAKMAKLEMDGRILEEQTNRLLEELEEQTNRLRKELSHVKASLADVELSRAGFESALAGAQTALAITRASTSWRITAPVRWFGNLASRRRRGR